MITFLFSTFLISLAEMGDKTQLLALVLTARFQKPLPIITGIFLATIINHALAGAVGNWVATILSPETLHTVLAMSFIAMAIWALIPDKLDVNNNSFSTLGIFSATFMLFFFAEMGDKTQLATIALAAQSSNMIAVVIGTTIGMLIANIPVVLVGNRITQRLPIKYIQRFVAAIFLSLGIFLLIKTWLY